MLQGLLAIALHASPCSSVSAASSTGLFAGHSAGLPSARQLVGEGAASWGGDLHQALRNDDEDSVQNEIKLHLGQMDDLINHMSQFQVRISTRRSAGARNPAQGLPASAYGASAFAD